MVVPSGCWLSLSARRAWIEITLGGVCWQIHHVALRKESVDRNGEIIVPAPAVMVALRKESVDRNCALLRAVASFTLSLSARRAWIEIRYYTNKEHIVNVALRKESVDRNMGASYGRTAKMGRSPQGERG